jgi:hypothetical protein
LQQQVNDPDALTDFRTPRYDLDSLYGRGPDDSPYLYEWTDPRFRGIKLLAGRNPDADVDGTPLTRQDLPRNEQGRALIGDPRNDENIIISQLHLAFIKLHDRVVDQIARLKLPDGQPRFTGRRLFEEARRWVRWHYQWMVVHDFLERVCGVAVVDSILKNEGAPTGPTVELQFYQPKEQPFMPIEFSAAAFRFGHSMIRPATTSTTTSWRSQPSSTTRSPPGRSATWAASAGSPGAGPSSGAVSSPSAAPPPSSAASSTPG